MTDGETRSQPARRPVRGARLRRSLPGLALVLLGLAVYGPFLDRGFTSEDFLLLRVLHEAPPWSDPAALLAGPWLGVEVVRFYRPLALILLGLEVQVFGGRPLGYNLVHLLVHLGSVLLVYRWVRLLLADAGLRSAAPSRWRERSGLAALAAAALFALHPLHPNSVSWIASYATPFAGVFVLAAAVSWEGWRRRGGGARWGGVALLYAAALACYEAAVVLPVALLLRELIVPTARPLPAGPCHAARPAAADEAAPAVRGSGAAESTGPDTRRPSGNAVEERRSRLLALLPLFALAVLYLLLRTRILGAAVGGYTSFTARLADPLALSADALTSLLRLLHPVFAPPWSTSVAVTGALAVVLLPVLVALVVHGLGRVRATLPQPGRNHGSGAAGWLRVWAFGWLWALVFLAPFAFKPPLPATGRFAYLALAGPALALGALVAVLPAPPVRLRRPGRHVLAAAVALLPMLLLAHWTWHLVGTLRVYHRAGELARQVTTRLAEQAETGPPGPALPAAPRHRAGAGPAGARDFAEGSDEGSPVGARRFEAPFRQGDVEGARGLAEGTREVVRDVFVAGHPHFLRNRSGVPVAHVLRYGLSDSQRPPFRSTGLRAWPLPDPGAVAPLSAALPHALALAWDDDTGRFHEARPPGPGLRELAASGPGRALPPPSSGAAADELEPERTSDAREVAYRALPGASLHRLVVLAEGNPSVTVLTRDGTAGVREAELPAPFVRSMWRLYGSPVLWWVEAVDAEGRRLAASRVRELAAAGSNGPGD